MEQKQENIYYKLQKSRVDLQQKPLNKTGKNIYAGYEYFDLKDYLPYINEICLENRINPIFDFESEEDKAFLILKDIDNLESSITFKTPIEILQLKGNNIMQNIRATQTYARNQLYTMAFEISENDIANECEVDEDAEQARKKIDPAAVKTIKTLLKETKADEKEFLKWIRADKVENIINMNLNIAIKKLEEKKEQVEKEKIKEEVDFL